MKKEEKADPKKEELNKILSGKKDVNDIINFYLENKKSIGFTKGSDMLKWYYGS